MAGTINNRFALRSPYSELIAMSKANGRHKSISGTKLLEASNRINSRVEKKIAQVQSLERLERRKSANWILK